MIVLIFFYGGIFSKNSFNSVMWIIFSKGINLIIKKMSGVEVFFVVVLQKYVCIG